LKIENKNLLDKIFSKSSTVDYSYFINHSLYDDKYGYYKNKDIKKDFFTSPITHNSFGKIISKQLKDVWEYYEKPRQFIVVELGGNSGKLKEDILESISKDKKFFNSIIYLNIDEVNGENLNDIEFEADLGCIISNEFFDALPFDRYLKDGQSIKKLFVKSDNGKLMEVSKKVKDFRFLNNDITSKIPEGSTFEIIKDLDLISKKLSSLFNYCVMITIDYGYNDYKKLFFKNPNGLVRCYSRHSMDKNILENVGEKDITCDVNFNYLNESLNKYGFIKIGNTSQEKFLIKNGLRTYFDNSNNETEKRNLISLINPDGMGGFHVYFHEKPNANFIPSCLDN
tara:strand:- start:150 stop:1169 length:1020 start_codon:yes stop_codon:yes gene_type:complete